MAQKWIWRVVGIVLHLAVLGMGFWMFYIVDDPNDPPNWYRFVAIGLAFGGIGLVRYLMDRVEKRFANPKLAP
jgi:hypothetical protein